MKALLVAGMTLAMVNCSGAHEDDASLEASEQQVEDGQVVVYDEQGEQQEQQEEVAQQDSQQQEEIVDQAEGENYGEELVSNENSYEDNNQQEAELNNMLNRISDEQEPTADDQAEENDNAQIADSTDDQNSYDDQVQNDYQEDISAGNNDTEQMNKEVEQDYASTSNDNQNYQTSGKVHIVEAGQSLSMISKLYYGKYKYWKGLASVNDISNPNIIYPGQRIQMVVAEQSASVGSTGNYQGGDYVVGEGETLGDVSRQVYGSSRYWKALYVKNKDKISNPDMIYQGQSLSVVPQADVARFQEEVASEVFAH